MSTFEVSVVRIGTPSKHPNADSLSVVHVHDYPVIFRTGDFVEGDLAVYVPVDAVVPDVPEFTFLDGHRRIKAKRLRGIFSMGLLMPAPSGTVEGEDVAERLGITKYEPPAELSAGGEAEPDPGFMPVYTDIESLRRWPDVLLYGEEVVLSEKLHGGNARFSFHEGRLWCGSHTQIKRETPTSMWWQAARRYLLAARLGGIPGFVFYGEVYGQVQDLRYDVPRSEGMRLAIFDVLDIATRRYLDHDRATEMISSLGLPVVPVLARGGWHQGLRIHAEGKSTIADNVREGFVVKPVRERWNDSVGRVILKLHGEGYLTRKGAQ